MKINHLQLSTGDIVFANEFSEVDEDLQLNGDIIKIATEDGKTWYKRESKMPKANSFLYNGDYVVSIGYTE